MYDSRRASQSDCGWAGILVGVLLFVLFFALPGWVAYLWYGVMHTAGYDGYSAAYVATMAALVVCCLQGVVLTFVSQ